MDDIRFNQTGVLLTIPTPFSATRAIRSERWEQSLAFGFCFFLGRVKTGKTISAPDIQVSNSSGSGVKNNLRKNASNLKKRSDVKPGLKGAFSLLRLQNTNPFLVRRQQRTKKSSRRQIREKNETSVIVRTFTFGMLKYNLYSACYKMRDKNANTRVWVQTL